MDDDAQHRGGKITIWFTRIGSKVLLLVSAPSLQVDFRHDGVSKAQDELSKSSVNTDLWSINSKKSENFKNNYKCVDESSKTSNISQSFF